MQECPNDSRIKTRQKRRELDVCKPHKYAVSCGGPVTFLDKFLHGCVLVVRNRVRFCQKLEKALNFPVFFMTFVFDNIQNYGYRRHDYRKQAKFDNGIDCNHA